MACILLTKSACGVIEVLRTAARTHATHTQLYCSYVTVIANFNR